MPQQWKDVVEDVLWLALISLAITIAVTFVRRYRRLDDIRAAYEIGRRLGSRGRRGDGE